MTRPPQVQSVLEAGATHPKLGQLLAIQQASVACLQCLRPLIPSALAPALAAGPLIDGAWCVLVSGSAAAAKVRQLVPAWVAHLRVHGMAVQSIRVRVRRKT